MDISMVGIDYSKASIGERERFSVTITAANRFAHRLLDSKKIEGCVVLSTCNRMEVWFSGLKSKSPLAVFLEEKGEIGREEEKLFQERSGEEAVFYLMELACGMHSQIFGEDQILSQMKGALEQAREGRYVDSVLELLFRTAVTAAKKVKTKVRLTREKTSVAGRAAKFLKENVGDLEHKTTLIIGNGEMGRMAAEELLSEGCEIWMTLRQYKKKDVVIPSGCHVIPYEDRIQFLPKADLIISATTSPHFTLKKEQLEGKLEDKNYYFVDLAVPRDIDPEISLLGSKAEIFDMDQLGIDNHYDQEAMKQAQDILKEYKDEFISWYYFREWIPVVQLISEMTGELTSDKLTKVYRKLDLSQEEKGKLKENIEIAAKKAVAKLIYGLREHLEKDKWNDCMTALEAAAREFKEG